MTLAELRVDIIVLACAVSAGIHAALTPSHFDEGTGAGLGFVAATVALAFLAVVLTRNPTSAALFAAGTVFAGLIVAYAFAVTTGVPFLHPDVEAADGLGLFTKAVEAIGLVAAASFVRQPSIPTLRQPKGTLT